MSGTLGGGYAIELWLAEDARGLPEAGLLDEVWVEFEREPGLDTSAVTVHVDAGGVATLSGGVTTYPQKQAVFCAACRVPGVERVSNEIIVRPAPAHERTDAELTRMAQLALEWNVLVPVGTISVTATGGVIRLDGEVDRDTDRRAAEETVERLIGVHGITNQVALRPAALPHNIKSLVDASLRRRLGTEARRVRVAVRGGALVLQGRVRTLFDRDSAERAALAVRGVTQIANEIVLRPFR
jgi:osmotically-inducible protein OsmY